MAFTGAARIVVAQTFILVDPNGVIVATLTNQPPGQYVNIGGDALLIQHNDPAVTDSFLFWTQLGNTNGVGNEEIVLSGPEAIGDAGVPPALVLSRFNATKIAQIQGATNFNVITQKVTTGVAGPALSLNATSGNISLDAPAGISLDALAGGVGAVLHLDTTKTVALGDLSNFSPAFTMDGPTGDIQFDTNSNIDFFDGPGNYRGRIYGVSFHSTQAAATVNTNGADQILATVNLPNAPLGGVIVASVMATASVIVGGQYKVIIYIDGGAAGPQAWASSAVAGTLITGSVTFHFPVGAGTHTASVAVNGPAGAYSSLGFLYSVSATYYR